MKKKRKKTALKLKRMALGLFQYELADRLHVKQAAVSRWENQGITSFKTAKKVASVLGCDWKELLE